MLVYCLVSAFDRYLCSYPDSSFETLTLVVITLPDLLRGMGTWETKQSGYVSRSGQRDQRWKKYSLKWCAKET